MEEVISLLALGAGLLVITYSTKWLIGSSVSIAGKMNIPKVLIGIVLLGFGTSAPEWAISISASLDGTGGISLGNVIGSDIANIALVLAITAILFGKITVESEVTSRDLPFLCVVTMIVALLMCFNALGRLAGLVLVTAFVVYTFVSLFKARSDNVLTKEQKSSVPDDDTSESLLKMWVISILSLISLVIASKVTVWGARELASSLGASDVLIGGTIVAVGTSLPELSSCYAAAKRGHYDLVVGNIIGSNIFNTLCVLGTGCLILPLDIPLQRTILYSAALITVTLLFFIVSYDWKNEKKSVVVNRAKGCVLLAVYATYTAFLVA